LINGLIMMSEGNILGKSGPYPENYLTLIEMDHNMNTKPICLQCGGDSLERTYRAVDEWNVNTKRWEQSGQYDRGVECNDCDDYINYEFVPAEFDKDKLKELSAEVLSKVYDVLDDEDIDMDDEDDWRVMLKAELMARGHLKKAA
jgi:hypothetical protein